jgi:hypothetical protein
MERHGEIVGLHGFTNGRQCANHYCCGEQVAPNDIVMFKAEEIDFGTYKEDAIKVILVHNGQKGCHVGFLPRNVVNTSKDKFDGKLAVVLELYDDSDSAAKRSKSYRNKGMASFRLINEGNM